jgi:protein involved in polysaccharide export with SLBB domain
VRTISYTFIGVFAFGLFFIRCAKKDIATPAQPPVVAKSAPYILGSRDVLDITVIDHPELSGKVAIDNEGNIELPLTGDLVGAAGLSMEQLQAEIAVALRKYLKVEPRVKIKIAEYESKVVYVVGAVGSQGKYPLKDYMIRLRDIIFEAGLPTEDADLSRVYIIKPDLTDPSYTTVNLHDILYKGILKENYLLQPGDIIYVRTTMLSKINKVLDQLLNPATKAAALFYLYTQWSNIMSQ